MFWEATLLPTKIGMKGLNNDLINSKSSCTVHSLKFEIHYLATISSLLVYQRKGAIQFEANYEKNKRKYVKVIYEIEEHIINIM